MNIFETACRLKLRFATRKGNLTIEDLLDLSLQSLDRVGKTVQEDIKDQQHSLLEFTPSDDTNDIKLKVVKSIIAEKQMKGIPKKSTNDIEEIL